MKKRYSIYLPFIVFLLTSCTPKAPEVVYTVENPASYAVALHSFCVEGTDVCFIFDGEKTALIDLSLNRDTALIEQYLRARKVSHLDYIVCAELPASGKYPLPSVGTIFSLGAAAEEGGVHPVRAGESFSLCACTVSFIEADDGISAVVTYEEGTFSQPLHVQATAGTTAEAAMVTIVNPSPDGIQTRITAKPLKEMLQ